MEQQELEGRFGPYKLLKRIARGGMGEVFLAKQDLARGYERTVVVKRILPHLSEDEQFVEMFLREAHTAARFEHKNIVRIYQVGQERSRYYLAMEYVEGKDLQSFLRRTAERGEHVPAEISCYIISEVCLGLGYAHTKVGPGGRRMHLVHRDVSPQNVLLSYDGNVRLIDFGIARAGDECSVTHPGRVEGKLPYMSPEQARGEPVDQRSDIFSTGLLLFELLCGRRLFAGSTQGEILGALRTFSADRALEPWCRNLPARLRPILERSLQENVRDRYETVEEMGRDLDGFLASSGFHAGTGTLARWMSRLFEQEMLAEGDLLARTRTMPATPRPGGMSSPEGAEARLPRGAAVRGDQRILKHKLVILVLLVIILLEAMVFVVREVHWRRDGLYTYKVRNAPRTTQPAPRGDP